MSDYEIGISSDHINLYRPGVDPDEAERSPGVSDDHMDFPRRIDDSEETEETEDTHIDVEVKISDGNEDESERHNDDPHIGCGAPGT